MKIKFGVLLMVGVMVIQSTNISNIYSASASRKQSSVVNKFELKASKGKVNKAAATLKDETSKTSIGKDNVITMHDRTGIQRKNIAFKYIGKTKKIQLKSWGSSAWGKGFNLKTTMGSGVSQQIITLKDKSAPLSYSFKYYIPKNAYLKQTYFQNEKGNRVKSGIEITDHAGNNYGYIATPWAVDANGKKVKSYYTIKKTVLKQHLIVSKANAYPIKADPTTWHTYFKYVHSYLNRKNPKKIRRIIGMRITNWFYNKMMYNLNYVSYAHSAWKQLKKYAHKHKKKISGWRNEEGLRKQFLCHCYYAIWEKRTFHLEPGRPNRSWVATVSKACNP